MTKLLVRDNDVSSGMKTVKRFAGKLLKDVRRRASFLKKRKGRKKALVKKVVQKVRKIVDNRESDSVIAVPDLRSGSAVARGLKNLLC